jgi:hypothetical protein
MTKASHSFSETSSSAKIAPSGIARDLAGRVGTMHERTFAGLSVPRLMQVSTFVHGMKTAEIRHFGKFRVPEKDSNL